MKRFSKIVSVMCEVPFARVISAMSCACRSVGKPGNGEVETSTEPMPEPLRATRTPVLVGVISTPACTRTSTRCAGARTTRRSGGRCATA